MVSITCEVLLYFNWSHRWSQLHVRFYCTSTGSIGGLNIVGCYCIIWNIWISFPLYAQHMQFVTHRILYLLYNVHTWLYISHARLNISQQLERLAIEVQRKLSLEKKILDQRLSFLRQQYESLFREYQEFRSSFYVPHFRERPLEDCPCCYSHNIMTREHPYSKVST